MKNLFKYCLIVFAAAVLMLFPLYTSSYPKTLKFVQLSDIHYSTIEEPAGYYKLLSKSKYLLEDAVSQINNLKDVNFVMVTGDGIDVPDQGYLFALTSELNNLKYPWYYALGNHDTNPDSFINKKNFIKILRKTNPAYKFDKLYYTFVPKKGYRVIVLDAAKEKDLWPEHAKGIMPEKELHWLDKILHSSKNDVILIFLHFPLTAPFEEKGHEILNADEFKAVLQKYNMPIAIFSGHYHAVKIIQESNILNVSSPALVSFPNAFRVIQISNSKDDVTFKFDFIETNLKELQKDAECRFNKNDIPIYYGTPEDRNTTIIMKKKNK